VKLTEKQEILGKLRLLLDTSVAGTATPWPEMQRALCKLTASEAAALHYRVERAIAESFSDGERAGSARARGGRY
jgi:hypothetical protein